MTAISARIAILLGGLFIARDVHGQFCSEGSLSPHTGFCYHVHAEKKAKIEDARLTCRNDYGGDIPSIFTGDENAFIHDLLSNEGSESNYWIGVNDLYEEDLFRDVMLNEVLTYDNWKSDEPDNAFGSDCAVMQRADGEWTDFTCTTFTIFAAGVICQQPPNPNPFTLCPANMLSYTTPWYTECYWISMKEYRALDASLECAAMGSKLAFIEDQTLNDFIHSYQQSLEFDTMWIGTQQILDGSGQFYQSVEFGTTTTAYYDNYISEYSGGESPVCAAMIRAEAGQWNHLSCEDVKHPYICRYNATVSNQNTTSAATTVGSTTTMATTTPTTTPSPTTTEATTIPTTTPTTTPSPTTTEAATTQATTIPTTTPTTTPSPTTTEAATTEATTIPTTTSPTTPSPTTEATTTLPTTTPNTTHIPTTTEPTTSEATTTVPNTTPTTTHSPTTTEGITTLSTTTTKLTTSPSTAESTTTLPLTTPTTNVITSQSTTTESTTSQSTTQEGSSSEGSTTSATTPTEPTPTTSETTPTVRMSTEETGRYTCR
ncbi:mucin-5AC-like [Strongylocentrotus purpuratus]|uniref:C-type lectin domain-containing protein n=1 Tax=Strongylocentrotus purpuratus TaxID=7668 RepID=A0A7M7NPD0_STRPU|nr:mucin-5AC-like [Strongylocentrotus purpuratus]